MSLRLVRTNFVSGGFLLFCRVFLVLLLSLLIFILVFLLLVCVYLSVFGFCVVVGGFFCLIFFVVSFCSFVERSRGGVFYFY